MKTFRTLAVSFSSPRTVISASELDPSLPFTVCSCERPSPLRYRVANRQVRTQCVIGPTLGRECRKIWIGANRWGQRRFSGDGWRWTRPKRLWERPEKKNGIPTPVRRVVIDRFAVSHAHPDRKSIVFFNFNFKFFFKIKKILILSLDDRMAAITHQSTERGRRTVRTRNNTNRSRNVAADNGSTIDQTSRSVQNDILFQPIPTIGQKTPVTRQVLHDFVFELLMAEFRYYRFPPSCVYTYTLVGLHRCSRSSLVPFFFRWKYPLFNSCIRTFQFCARTRCIFRQI